MAQLLSYISRRLNHIRLWFHHATRLTTSCSVNNVLIQMEAGGPRELSRIISYSSKEPSTIVWIDNYIRAGDVFYDVGANIGQYSLYAALKCREKIRVYSFEPESQNYAALNRNIYINGLANSITSLCLAVSDETTVDVLNVCGSMNAGGAIHQFGLAVDHLGVSFKPVHKQGMMGVSLDDLHFVYGLDFPNCIKIDVDGQESRVLKGGMKILSDSRLRTVLIEISEGPSRMEESEGIYETFEKEGFAVVDKVSSSLEGEESCIYNVVFSRMRVS